MKKTNLSYQKKQKLEQGSVAHKCVILESQEVEIGKNHGLRPVWAKS
jgi:hypothetical protein